MAEKLDPPRIPNAEYVAHLGSGGFADVFLYRQHIPDRDIAVKVLRRNATSEENGAFEAEANLMARMSTHPSILSVFGAGVSEDGRSYLVMEYCPPPHMGARVRKHPLTVARALDMGIRLAGAVETLHRAGILHRDIKPGNILITEFGNPVLTDFGIAVSTAPGSASGDLGFSVPWAPPEQQTGEGPFGRTTDVFSLAATIDTFLRGCSPFEVLGGDNREVSILNRVLRAPVPSMRREDVPPALERILAIAMAKNPADRFPTVLDFAHALQQVQHDMQQQVTKIDVTENRAPDELDEDESEATRARAFEVIDPGGAQGHAGSKNSVRNTPSVDPDGTRAAMRTFDPGPGWKAPPQPVTFHVAPTQHGAAASSPSVSANQVEEGILELPVPIVSAESPVPPPRGEPQVPRDHGRRRGRVLVAAAVAIMVVGLALFGGWSFFRGEGMSFSPEGDEPVGRPDGVPVASEVSPVEGLTGTVQGDQVVFTWNAVDGDTTYLFRIVDPLEQHQVRETDKTETTVDTVDGRTCLEVVARAGDGAASAPSTECVETP